MELGILFGKDEDINKRKELALASLDILKKAWI